MDQSPATAAQQLALKEWACVLGKKWALFLAVAIGDTEAVVRLLAEGVSIDTKYHEGKSLLHMAAEGGHVTTMRHLFSRGCDVDSVDDRGLTPLHLAAAMGQTKAVIDLIRNGASKSIVANTSLPPLHVAVFQGHVETVVAMMIEGCPVDAVDTTTGFTVLHAAAEGGCVAMIRILYKRCNLNAIDSVGCTPLHIAAANGQTEFAVELIKLGANTSVIAGTYETPLRQAALAGHLETVVAMLEKGCPLDTVDSVGSTVLYAAAQGGHAEILRELVHRGCDVNAVTASGSTPLHHAASCGRTEAVCELIKLGATKSVVASTFGTPLHQAAIGGHVETIVAMLEEGCPLTTVANNGSTALHWAAEGGHVEVMRELISRGYDVNAVDANGCTPLHSAVTFGRTEAVRELITLSATKSVISGTSENPCCVEALNGHERAGANLLEKRPANGAPQSIVLTDTLSSPLATDYVNSANNNGLTPLMWAFGGGHVGVCSLLVGNGALITAKDKYGWLVFEHCFVGGHASKLSQFCEACGIRSCGERLRDALATLITLRLVDARKVLCLCAIPGDSLFLDSDFTELVTFDCSPLPMIVKYAKAVFTKEVTVIDELNLPDDSALNPLHISLLSLKLYEMGHITYLSTSDAKGSNDHTLFITKLLSHPVLKEAACENFQNGLSPLDLAQQFELHHIAALIEGVGGRPGVWADIPQEIEVRHPLALPKFKEAYASMKAIAEDSECGRKFIKRMFSSILELQTAESEAQTESLLAKEQDSLWHPNAVIVGADVGPETDEHEYKSLMVPADKSKKPPPMRPCKDASEVLKKMVDHSKEINAMLNHHTGGTVHFGIQDEHNTVEEGLDLPQAVVVDKLQTRVGQLLQEFYPAVQSQFVAIQPVQLLNSTREPTGRWRFDICVSPHDRLVFLGRSQPLAYYRQGGNSVPMPADVLMERLQDSSCGK